jgi:glycosyltransferase involved in cell wall biosynthesis
MTTYQPYKTIKSCMESILAQIDDRFEVVVVDNLSTDGSHTYLRRLADERRIRFISTNCNRGQGRQIAAENAIGDVLVQQVDADQVYRRFLPLAVDKFEQESLANSHLVLILKASSRSSPFHRIPSPISITKKENFLMLSRWPSINYAEDLHVFDPFYRAGLCKVVTDIDYATQIKGHILEQAFSVIMSKKQMFDDGFSSHDVLSLTDYKGPALIMRSVLVLIAFFLHKLRAGKTIA